MMDELYSKLNDLNKTLNELTIATGAKARYDAFRAMIVEHGWEEVVKVYHPDNNIHEPAKYEIWAFAKFVKDRLKKEGRIK
jgi:hypothetical protein